MPQPPTPRAPFLVALLAAALVIRVAVVAVTPDLPLASDPADYARHAVSIAAGEGYPPSVVARGATAVRPPGFPYFLGAVYALSGDSETAARLAQALVGTLVVGLTGVLGALLWGRPAGLVAAAIATVYPPLIISGASLLSEPLFTAYLLAATIAMLMHRRTRAARWAAGAGVLAGLAVLTRPTGAPLLVILAAAAWGTARPRALGAAGMPALVLLTAVLTVAPWTARNAIVLRELIPISTNGGYTLAGTYNRTSRKDRRYPAAWRPANFDPVINRLLDSLAGRTEHDVNAALGSAARRYALEHPGYVVTVAGHNLTRLLSLGGRDFHRLATFSEQRLGARWSDFAMYGFFPFALLALVGACSPAARAAPRFVWLVPLAMAGVVLIIASQRFRVPIDPFIVLLAAAGVCWALPGRPRAAG